MAGNSGGFEGIERNIGLLAGRMLAEVGAAADESAKFLESYAKQTAPWTDRTGNLRNSIAGEASTSASGAVIVLRETMEYAPYVEQGTSRAKAFSAIWPAIMTNVPVVLEIFKRNVRL